MNTTSNYSQFRPLTIGDYKYDFNKKEFILMNNKDEVNQKSNSMVEDFNNISEEAINILLSEMIPNELTREKFKKVLAQTILLKDTYYPIIGINGPGNSGKTFLKEIIHKATGEENGYCKYLSGDYKNMYKNNRKILIFQKKKSCMNADMQK